MVKPLRPWPLPGAPAVHEYSDHPKCPKCTTEGAITTHHNPAESSVMVYTSPGLLGCDKLDRGHLHIRCSTCQYQWVSETADFDNDVYQECKDLELERLTGDLIEESDESRPIPPEPKHLLELLKDWYLGLFAQGIPKPNEPPLPRPTPIPRPKPNVSLWDGPAGVAFDGTFPHAAPGNPFPHLGRFVICPHCIALYDREHAPLLTHCFTCKIPLVNKVKKNGQ